MILVNDRLPQFDVHCAIMGLPRVLGTTLETIPADIPYLFADPQLSEKWNQRLPADGRLKIGISWAGRPTHPDDRKRSIPLMMFAPLAAIPNARFISLQKGEAATEINKTPPGFAIEDWTDELHDFADTAALIANLDLVITADTAVAHLAGAMGKPVWVLLPFFPDWRWMMNRQDSPWYPTMKLFRQPGLGDWPDVMGRVVGELRKLGK
jgi:ADP-heptose:LPS heptosyltransferase